MVANRLKRLVSITKEAVKDARQTLEDLVNAARPQPQPALVRVPVRNAARASPFKNYTRNFSTTRAIRASSTYSSTTSTSSIFKHYAFVRQPRLASGNLANNIWAYSSFRNSTRYPGSSLYRHFIQINARNFHSYGSGQFTREAVNNLTSGLRCMFNNGTDTLLSLKMTKQPNHHLTYHGCSSTNQAQEVFKMAKSESTGVEKAGSYVEFTLPALELSIPSMSFINSEILDTMEDDFETIKERIDRTSKNIAKIFDAYGSLPIERREGSVRIHFPNLEVDELERLLIELGIDDGLVYSNEEVEEILAQESAASSITSLSDLMEDNAPGLISSSDLSDDDSSSVASFDFFPVLSSNSDYMIRSGSIDEFIATGGENSHVMIFDNTASFSTT